MIAYKDGGGVRLVGRNGRDHTVCFADIAGAVAKLPVRTLILDGLVSHIYLPEATPEELATPPVASRGGRASRASPGMSGGPGFLVRQESLVVPRLCGIIKDGWDLGER